MHIDIFKIILACTNYRQVMTIPTPAFSRDGNFFPSSQICCSERLLGFYDFVDWTLCNNFAAFFPCTRTKIDNPICPTNCSFIMFNNQNCVAHISQSFQSS